MGRLKRLRSRYWVGALLKGVVQEAIQKLSDEEGIAANLLQIKWIVPLHGSAITAAVSKGKKLIIVENNYSGQFARYLRSETGDRRRRSHSQV